MTTHARTSRLNDFFTYDPSQKNNYTRASSRLITLPMIRPFSRSLWRFCAVARYSIGDRIPRKRPGSAVKHRCELMTQRVPDARFSLWYRVVNGVAPLIPGFDALAPPALIFEQCQQLVFFILHHR
jgi:hypothetical protein